ncbi:MAG: exo-beta-N-acetylmuramidase NamZ family protein [Nitritalea sp.]
MKPSQITLLLLFFSLISLRCHADRGSSSEDKNPSEQESVSAGALDILAGADQPERYLPLMAGKRLGLIVNQSSLLQQAGKSTHLVDFLLAEGQQIQKIFVPEHGFRGNADAGERIGNETDPATGLPLLSLYGDQKKPQKQTLEDVDLLVFDLQDVGVRFYTYISTLHYVLEAAAEAGKPVLILDRPNPNGDYVAGPILKKGFESFVGIHPIPVVHGLTVAELARMINGEAWLSGGLQAEIEVVTVANWNHQTPYELPVRPSPNLPNYQSIRLYPSLCFFEGTEVSVGRGTPFPFQVYGYPQAGFGPFSFTPAPTEGAKNPPHKGKQCYGQDLRAAEDKAAAGFTLEFVLDAYQKSGKGAGFFTSFFDKLAGTDALRKGILAGMTAEELEESWAEELHTYKKMREKYLLYE